jgi:hypothetical protein
MVLVRATEADLSFIMATQRTPGYEDLVGRSDQAEHRAALADPGYAYFVARLAEERVGFAIVRDWASAEQVTLIKRVAVSRPARVRAVHSWPRWSTAFFVRPAPIVRSPRA